MPLDAPFSHGNTPRDIPVAGGDRKHPLSLTLVFTNAANGHAVHRMFDPDIKSKIDPHGYVVKRENTILERQIANGHGALLVDSRGEPFALTMAWYSHAPGRDQSTQHCFTEIGTTLARLHGFQSAQIVVAAQTLREWWKTPPRRKIVTELLADNERAQKLYVGTLGWIPVHNKKASHTMTLVCNGNVVEDVNSDKLHVWHRCEKSTLSAMASHLLNTAAGGTLRHKNGDTMTVNLNDALDGIGLTQPRLRALAAGTTDKRALRAIAP